MSRIERSRPMLKESAKSRKLSLNDLDILDALADDLENAIRLFK